jgi:hypothetical protein
MSSSGVVSAFGACLLAVNLSGCEASVGAVAGVAVAPDGSPIGVIQVCDHSIDGATLYDHNDEGAKWGTWTANPSVSGFSQWPLRSGGGGWSVSVPLGALKPGVTYSFYGWTNDSSSSANAVSFTARDLASMEPGQVRYVTRYSDKDNSDLTATISADEFRQTACKNLLR